MKKLYILLILLSSMLVKGQTPGGVQGVTIEYWLSADEVLLNNSVGDGASISNWMDKSIHARHFYNSTGFTPRYIKSAMNYHAAVEFYNDEETAETDSRRRKLESIGTYQVDPNRSYYVIWISRLENDSFSGSLKYAPVFTVNSASSGDNYGWIAGTGNDAQKLWHETRGSSYTHSHLGKAYGIGIAVMPNKTGTGALAQSQYLNGLASTTTMAARTMASTATKSIIGGTDPGSSNTYYYYGEVMEVMVLSRPAGSTGVGLSADELRKINTHFAIKYGVSLDPSTPNYILSDGTLIYSGIQSGYTLYNKDIFGIARDDASGLHQKQAMSADDPALAISLGEFKETNKENLSELTDKHALILGANGLTGTQSYSHDTGTSFVNYTLQTHTDPITGVVKQEKLTTLFNYKLRAKTTGQTSFTVNARIGIGTWLLVSNTPDFIPSQTRIYKSVDGEISNVVINDGDYIGFTSEFVAPGGVTSGLRMWLNASQRQTLSVSSGEIQNWTDYSGIGTTYRKKVSNNSAPQYVEQDERTNYHPTPVFRGAKDYLITDKAAMSKAIPDDVAFYAVVNHNFATSRSYFIGFGQQSPGTNARRPAFGVYRGSESNGDLDGKGRMGSTGLSNSPSRLFNAGATTIAGYHWKVGTGVTFEFDGGHSEFVNHKYNNVLMNGPGMLGLGSSSSSYYLQGVMPEVILYEGILTANEKERINSYLGLKYAITIKLGTVGSPNFNYLLSDNTSVWNGNATANRNFHHNVAGVVRDDNADLYNHQAKSTDLGAIVHMGVGTKIGLDPVLGSIIHDKSALVWGHNDGALTRYSFAGNQQICGEMDSRLTGRIWMVENTNFDQSILVRAATSDFPYNGSNWQVFLLVADSPTKLTNNQWDRVIPMDFLYEGHQVNYKFPKDQYTYFTFAAKALPGICESCDFSGIKKLEFTKTNWAKGSTANTYNLGDGFTADVKVTIESPATLRSRYPRPSSLKSLREYRRRGVGDNAMVTEVTLKQGSSLRAAATSFEIFEIDRYGGRFSDVEVYGVCGSGIVMPNLSYTAKKNSYRIAGNKAKGYTSSSYASPKGRMYVEFDVPVEKIYVVHKFTGRNGSGTMRIGIGPMEFYCLPPTPTPNEEGLIFTKQGPPEMLLCEEAVYTFRISNTNCAPYQVNFSDVLPVGMQWVGESLAVDETAIAQATINNYEHGRTLDIQNLIVPGTATLTFRARAIFDREAQPGTYENRGKLSYQPLTGTPRTIELLSCDRLLIGCEPTRTVATGDPTIRPLPIEVISTTSDKGCYKENDVVTVFLKVKNPNAFNLENMLLELDYNEEFSYVNNSITSSTISFGGSVLVDTAEAGSILIEDFVLPPGEHMISFKIKAPTAANLVMVDIDPLDPSQGQIETPLFIDYDLINESDDACLNASTSNAYGSLEMAYCVVCYYDPVVGDNGNILDSSGYLVITTLNRPDRSWIPSRGNAFMVLESKTKGMVISRLTTTQIMQLSPVAGMLVYDTTLHCLKMFNGTTWGCLDQGCVDE
ncbi:hypothetical protein HX004_17200 [Myroides sp. 1354]|uniref:hypothetical protein n=1 Tax=unclassified Myroides TaxID=2642485 RepID=UPI002577E119|nr:MULTISPECIES: hypothetical protein [unclassified Myroides]MDM1046557.1 hypothetical protein [Myroides sp. R163-1]MDM1057493.1 hypothetical protein [Myroides sp. 1354]MDM1070766.1 hypothetical protein [Myroides sp. 1372]